ncbi:hypothetical protein PMAYCL1PPCAC_30930, partial [Pristionchus mayeri]
PHSLLCARPRVAARFGVHRTMTDQSSPRDVPVEDSPTPLVEPGDGVSKGKSNQSDVEFCPLPLMKLERCKPDRDSSTFRTPTYFR